MINRLRFLCLLIVVMIHSAVHMQPEAIAQLAPDVHQAAKNWHAFFYSPLSLEILFILSAYLFFRGISDTYDLRRDYLCKLKKRMTGLVLPYLVWNVVYIAHNILRCHLSWDDLSSTYFLDAFWPPDPLDGPCCAVFWFIRSLICFTLLSPLYYLIYKYFRHFTFIIVFLIILSPLSSHFMYGNAYLLLGGYLAYSGITLTRINELFSTKVALPLALLLSALQCFHPELLPFSAKAVHLALLLLWLSALIGICTVMRLPAWCTPAAGMFLYASHFFVCCYIGIRCIRFLPLNLPMLVADMWITMILSTLLCLGLYALIRKIPHASFLLTGGR